MHGNLSYRMFYKVNLLLLVFVIKIVLTLQMNLKITSNYIVFDFY